MPESCYKKEAENFFFLAQSRKLSDVFSNGFLVPDGLKPLIDQSKLVKYGYNNSKQAFQNNKKVYNLFDIVLQAITNTQESIAGSSCKGFYTYSYSVAVENGIVVGFTNYESEEGEYKIINIQPSEVYSKVCLILYSFMQIKTLMLERLVNSNKTVLKSDLTQASTTKLMEGAKNTVRQAKGWWFKKNTDNLKEITPSNPIDIFIDKINRPVQEQLEAISESSVSSVLNLPDGYDLTFPSGDINPFLGVYTKYQELIGAVLQMPLTKIFGTPPTGFQATGQYDSLSYEQVLDSIANQYCVPILKETALILGYTQEEIDSIKYLSMYQIDVCMKLIDRGEGTSNPIIKQVINDIVEAKLGVGIDDIGVEDETKNNTIDSESDNVIGTDNVEVDRY